MQPKAIGLPSYSRKDTELEAAVYIRRRKDSEKERLEPKLVPCTSAPKRAVETGCSSTYGFRKRAKCIDKAPAALLRLPSKLPVDLMRKFGYLYGDSANNPENGPLCDVCAS